jgi:DNA-binding XRE family transcriptional regulator
MPAQHYPHGSVVQSILLAELLQGFAFKFQELFQSHVKHSLIQVDFKVKKNRMPKFKSKGKLGPVVAYFRNKAGMTEDQLAEKMGVSKTLISRVENGETGLTDGSLDALLIALDVTGPDFFARVWTMTDFGRVETKSSK